MSDSAGSTTPALAINFQWMAVIGFGATAAIVLQFVRPALPGPGLDELLRYVVTGAAVTVLGESMFRGGSRYVANQ